jgi:hypothetical protein
MTPVICIPYHKSNPIDIHREKAYQKTKEYYSKLSFPTFYGDTYTDSLNRAKLRNYTVNLIDCDYDLILFFDADVLVPYKQIQEAIKLSYETNEMVIMYDFLYLLSERVTEQYYRDNFLDDKYGTRIATPPSGAFVVPRNIWETVGGQDERFTDWGGEDRAFYFACAAVKNKRVVKRISGKAWHLYHPRKKYTLQDLHSNPILQKYVKAVGACPRFTVPNETLEDNSKIFSILKEKNGPLYVEPKVEPTAKEPMITFVTRGRIYEKTELNSPTYRILKSDPQFREIKLPNITVSIPCYKSRGLLRKAVNSVLNQTYPNFELLVISDNDPDNTIEEIKDIKNPKLKIIELDENIGRYAIDHMVVNELSRYGFWIPFDSDDYCDKRFLSNLMNQVKRKNEVNVVLSDQYLIQGKRKKIESVHPWNKTNKFTWHAHQSGLWNREFLQDTNLTNPNFRVGWDSIMTSVPWIFGKVKILRKPFYYRVHRKNSLTTSYETGFRSEYREKVKKYLIYLWSEIVKNKNYPEEIKKLLLESRKVVL